jgi:hypothetical protein
LEAHLLAQGSGTLLRARVKEVLGEMREPDPTETEVVAVSKADELLEADPLDASRLFFEELRMISRALREIGPGEVTDEDLAEIMPAVDQITLTLQKIARRKERGREEVDDLAGPPLPAVRGVAVAATSGRRRTTPAANRQNKEPRSQGRY